MAKPTGNVDLFNLPPQLKHHEIKEKLKYSFMLSHGETWWLYSAKDSLPLYLKYETL